MGRRWGTWRDGLERAADVALEWSWRARSRARDGLEQALGEAPGRVPGVVVYWPRHYDWELTPKWVDGLKAGLARQAKLVEAHLPQPFERIVLFELSIGGQRVPVALDYADLPEVNATCARQVRHYFKMQYRREGYALSNVVPGGFVPGNPRLESYLPHVRALRDAGRFRHDVLGRFSLAFASETRQRALRMLAGQERFDFTGGTKLMRYSRYLREIATARVCVDLPGNGPFCFRLVDCLAVGACVVAVRHKTTMPRELVDGEHLAYVREDLSDLVETCARYVEDDLARERLARNARAFFDGILQVDALARCYLHACLAGLPWAGREYPTGGAVFALP
ncbi:MAG: glycosyltransferase [Myxococcaceae bacterium]